MELTSDQKKIIRKWIRNADKIALEININGGRLKRDKAKKICKTAIDRYYAEYTPGASAGALYPYDRWESLYDAVDIGCRSNGEFIFEVGEELIHQKHRVDNKYIYDMMFVGGWHGGANKQGNPNGIPHPKPGTPYWKVAPFFKEWWLTPAPRSSSPYDEIKNKWKLFLNSKELHDKALNFAIDAFKKYM